MLQKRKHLTPMLHVTKEFKPNHTNLSILWLIVLRQQRRWWGRMVINVLNRFMLRNALYQELLLFLFREYAKTIPRSFSVRYNPYTKSVEVIENKNQSLILTHAMKGTLVWLSLSLFLSLCYMAEILPVLRKTLHNQSINLSLMRTMYYYFTDILY